MAVGFSENFVFHLYRLQNCALSHVYYFQRWQGEHHGIFDFVDYVLS